MMPTPGALHAARNRQLIVVAGTAPIGLLLLASGTGNPLIGAALMFVAGTALGLFIGATKLISVIWIARQHAIQCERLLEEFRAEQIERAASIGKEDTHGNADTVRDSARKL